MKFSIVQSNSSDTQSLELSKVQNYPEFRLCSGNIYVSREKQKQKKKVQSKEALFLNQNSCLSTDRAILRSGTCAAAQSLVSRKASRFG